MSLSQRLTAACIIALATASGGGCLCWLTGDCVEKLKPPVTPSPADGSANVPVTVSLSWGGGDPLYGNPIRHDLYLSATNPPLLYRPSVTGRSVTINELAKARTYYWRVVLIEESGRNTFGPIWSFTTEYPAKFLAVAFPNWATSWARGETRSIQWRSSYAGNDARIELFKAGTNLCTIAESTPNDGYFEWEMSSCAVLDDPDYRIKVTALADETLYDYSDFFTVSTGCPLEVTNPQERDLWITGELRPVLWRPLGVTDNVKIQLQLYRGSNYQQVIAPITGDDGSFDWVVGATGSGHDYRVRVTAMSALACSEFSDFFSIQACSLRITSPSEDDIWPIGTQQMITWDTTLGVENMTMELYHGGEFVCVLDRQVHNTGSYLWTVTRCQSLFGESFQLKLTGGDNGPCGFSGRFDLH